MLCLLAELMQATCCCIPERANTLQHTSNQEPWKIYTAREKKQEVPWVLAVIKGAVTAGSVCNTRTPHVTLLAAPRASFSQSHPEFLFVPKTDTPREHRGKHPDPATSPPWFCLWP